MNITKDQLKTIIIDQQKQATLKLKRYTHREIEPKVIGGLKSGFINVITGLRRSGKSTLLQHIRSTHPNHHYYLDFDDERLINFQVNDFQALVETFLELYGPSNYFYFDEIQNIVGWERFARRLHNEGRKVLITGSNANLLSKELGTHLTGRYLQHTLYPFSFREFLNYQKFKLNPHHRSTKNKVELLKQFKRYLKLGGLPEYLRTKNPEVIKLLYENILYRDIVARYNLDKEQPLRDLVHFCATNPGKEISFAKLAKLINVKSSTTVKDYLFYLENVYLTFLLAKHNWSIKKQWLANKKIYLIDSGLIRQVGFHFSHEQGRLLENTVFLELKRQGQNIFYFKDKHECDFIVQVGNQVTQAIQVTYSLAVKNYQREIDGLVEAMDTFKLKNGLILTMDQSDAIKVKDKTITIMPIWQWLINS